jgi:hypothetical protein
MILQLEDSAVQMLAKTIEEDGLEICTEGMQKHRTIDEYVWAWRNQIWEYGYSGWFKGKDAYSKTKAFEDHPHSKLAIKRVIFRFEFNRLFWYSPLHSWMCGNEWIMWLHLRYFMRELVPLGAVVKPQLPIFLTSWVDKASASCMYTMTQTRTWSVPHLKEGCWYIESGKSTCPVEEEDVKVTCDKDDPRGIMLGSDNVAVSEELSAEDLTLLPEKERNKILNQRTRDTKKAERESTRATTKVVRDITAQKGAKKGEKPGKSKVITPQLLLAETSTATPSHKRDSSIAHLSVSRLQQLASPSLMDSVGGGGGGVAF